MHYEQKCTSHGDTDLISRILGSKLLKSTYRYYSYFYVQKEIKN